jgi:hypothetical protein
MQTKQLTKCMNSNWTVHVVTNTTLLPYTFADFNMYVYFSKDAFAEKCQDIFESRSAKPKSTHIALQVGIAECWPEFQGLKNISCGK